MTEHRQWWIAPCLWLTLPLTAVSARAADSAEDQVLVFAAGNPQGNYHAVAAAMEAELGNHGWRVQVRETQGSYDNAALLRDGTADLGLLQSDVAYLEHYNLRPFMALASVYTEPIHVIAYRGLNFHRVSDLLLTDRDLVAVVGATGSGSSAHGLAILDELGLPARKLKTIHASLAEASPGLRARDYDLAFLTSAVPSQAVKGLADDQIISLLAIDQDIARKLRRRNPFFVAAEIPYGAYGVSGHNIQTLGTRTLLVARPTLSREAVFAVLDALYSVAARAHSEGLFFLEELSPTNALHDLAIPTHPASRSYHAGRAGLYQRWAERIRHHAVPLLVLAILLLALLRLSRLAYFIHQFILGRVLAALIAIWLLGSAAMHLLEGEKNSAFRTFGSSAIAILHYLFSGMESKYPVTTGGNLVAILVLSLGVGIVTLFTATLVTILVERALNIRTLRRKPVPFLKLSGHTVIAGWSERTKRVIRQLRSPDLAEKPTVVVITPDAAATKVRNRSNYRGVWVVEGDPTEAETLKNADIASAANAVMICSGPSDRNSEAASVCFNLAIHRVAPNINTIIETRNTASLETLSRIRTGEAINTQAFAERFISQCIVTPGIAQVFDELLSFGTKSQEIYILPIGSRMDGSSFREIHDRLATCNAIPLGYWLEDESEPCLNPSGVEASAALHASGANRSRLIVLADSPKNFSSTWAQIRQWRYAMSKPKRIFFSKPNATVDIKQVSSAAPPRYWVQLRFAGRAGRRLSREGAWGY